MPRDMARLGLKFPATRRKRQHVGQTTLFCVAQQQQQRGRARAKRPSRRAAAAGAVHVRRVGQRARQPGLFRPQRPARRRRLRLHLQRRHGRARAAARGPAQRAGRAAGQHVLRHGRARRGAAAGRPVAAVPALRPDERQRPGPVPPDVRRGLLDGRVPGAAHGPGQGMCAVPPYASEQEDGKGGESLFEN